jgi:hypothetical protein
MRQARLLLREILKPNAVDRLRRLSNRAAAVCCIQCTFADRHSRAKCRDGPRQQSYFRFRVTAIAGGFLHEGKRRAGRPKSSITGNPVRPAVMEARKNSISTHLEDDGPLCGWWSLAAARAHSFFSDSVPEAVAAFARDELRSRLRITQQARPEDETRVKARYGELGVEAEVSPFFADLAVDGLPQRTS